MKLSSFRDLVDNFFHFIEKRIKSRAKARPKQYKLLCLRLGPDFSRTSAPDQSELTFSRSLSTVMVIQLSVEKAIASKAAATRLKMVAKARVTALQKPITTMITVCLLTSLPVSHSL